MCIKEFLGFICGHCTIPSIRQCPLALQNKEFPFCGYPAEHPIQTQDYCHGCARVLWNMRVLAEEDNHKKQHEVGFCHCGIVFNADERQIRPIATWHKGNSRRKMHHQQSPSNVHSQTATNKEDLPQSNIIHRQREGHEWSTSQEHKSTEQRQGVAEDYYGGDVKSLPYLQGQFMNWYSQEDQYRGVPFGSMIVGAEAVLKAGGAPNVPNYASMPVPQEASSNCSLPALRLSSGTSIIIEKPGLPGVPDLRSPVPDSNKSIVDKNRSVTTAEVSKGPVVVSSDNYRCERSTSAPPH
jgi:hypothetical protein